MLVAEHRFEPAGQRRVGEQPVQIDGRFGHGDDMAARGDRTVEKGQHFAVAERAHLGHEASEQVKRTIRLGDEAGKRLSPVAALRVVAALDQRSARRVRLIGRRQEGERQIIAALEMRARAFERRAPFLIDQPRRRIGKAAVGITQRFAPLGLEMECPARAEAPPMEDDRRAGRPSDGIRADSA